MTRGGRSIPVHLRLLIVGTACWLGALSAPSAAAEPANPPEGIPAAVQQLADSLNDDAIQFNDQLVTLGNPDAKAAAVLVFGLSGDTSDLVQRWLPTIIEKYVATGKLKIVVIDFPLTWHDMQALAGFRCVPADRHWDLLKEAVRFHGPAYYMKVASVMDAPGHAWKMMKDFGVPREQAERCMRNAAIMGHVEAQRRIVTDTWNTNVAPTFIVGRHVLRNPGNIHIIEEAIDDILKGGS